jgi:hypothetical protein
MPTELHLTLGAAFLLITLVPSIAFVIVTGNFAFFSGLNLWLAISGAIATGILAGVNFLDTGLNSTGTMIAFVAAVMVTYYAVISGEFPLMGIPAPFDSYLEIATVLFFGLGVGLIIMEK